MDILKRHIIVRSCFALGVCIVCTGIAVATVKHFVPENGKGGLETPGPEFSSSDLDGLEASDIGVPDQPRSTADAALSYQSYRVQPGDMISAIADEFGVTQDTIISMNNIQQSRLLQVGQYLKVPSMPGILYTVRKAGETVQSISENYKIDAARCAQVNGRKETESLKAGETLFLPDAVLDWVTRQEINGDLFTAPLHSRYYLSSYYGWRASPFTGRRSFHSGIDMAAPMGTAIYAALSGRVSSTGYNETYGNYVIVAHHSGYKTLYGHMSVIIAVTGQAVSPGTCLGRVGNTGLSTGPHLHFTVFKNGKMVNPLNLLK